MSRKIRAPWIQTLNGNAFNYAGLLAGEPQPFDLEEIAHCLSAKYRYSGHTKPLISVGEHSIRVSQRVGELTQFDRNACACALMHDAPEAYLGDVNRPLKDLFRSQGVDLYTRLEDEAERQIAKKFDLEWTDEIHKLVKQADNETCAWEKKYILGPGPRDEEWAWLPELPEDCRSLQIYGHSPHNAYNLFLRECGRLGIE